MKVYVAGKWSERSKVRELMNAFELYGHEVTCDWTKHEDPCKSEEYSVEDINAIKECDVLIAYMPSANVFYKGAWVEIGAALALDKKVIIIGNKVSSVFLSHPNINYFENILMS